MYYRVLHIHYTMQKIPQVTAVFNRRGTASARTRASIEIRVTYDRRQKYISTGIFIYPRQWRNGTIVNHEDSADLNGILQKILADIRKVLHDMAMKDSIDIFAIPDELQKLHDRPTSFIDYCIGRAEVRKYRKAAGTVRRYSNFLAHFQGWGIIKNFEDVTDSNIILYDQHLVAQGLKESSKWNNYHRFLNSFILDAMRDGYLSRNPYNWIALDKAKGVDSINKHLTIDEFNRIRSLEGLSPFLERTRDIFIFQTYTCLSYTDLRNFDPSGITEVKGMKVYRNFRAKTRNLFTIPLLETAVKILEKYRYSLPVTSNFRYNKALKKLAQAAGISKPISSHWARHTGATILLNEGVDIRIISKICGHSSTRITEEVYARLLDETIVDAVSNVNI